MVAWRETKVSKRIGAWVKGRPRGAIALWLVLSLPMVSTAAIGVEALVRARLKDEVLHGSTRFYTRPLVLESGGTVDRDRVEGTLRRLGYRQTRRWRVGIGEYYLGSDSWVIGRRAFRQYQLLDPGGVVTVETSWGGRVSRIEDENGRRLQSVALEPELLGVRHGGTFQDRVPVPLSDMPQHLIDAVLSIEDQRFFAHHGLDFKRVGGAAVANLRSKKIVQGASTITQQLAKNLFLSNRRSPIRKLREMAMALVLEARYSKDQILEAYLNEVYFAQNGALAIHGVGRAAQFFFGKDVSRLDVTESALLAGIIRGPSIYSPVRHPEAAKERRDLVLRLMGERGLLSEADARRAQRAAVRVRNEPQRAQLARYYLDFASEYLRRTQGDRSLRGGHSVFTTLDLGLQESAEQAVRSGLTRLERDYPRLSRQDQPLQAALVAIRPQTGEILALVGGRDYGASQFNRAVHARRQPGSSFKPVVALSALARSGGGFTLASWLEDEPLSVETPAGLWEPENYDQQFRGRVTLRDALERSLNVPFARLGMAVGPEHIVETARTLGIESPLTPVYSLALGSNEVTLLELTRAYGVLAAEGFRAGTQVVLGVLDDSGGLQNRARLSGEQIYEPAEAYLVTSALRGAVERGTGRALRSMGFMGDVAAKSGTTNDYRDAWFIGYTPTLAVGVWVGFDDGRSIGLGGSRAALPIFARFLVDAVGRYGGEEFSRPYGVDVVEVNQQTGLRAGPGCRGEAEVFLRGTAPYESCSGWTLPRRRSSSIVRLIDEFRRRLSGRN